MTDYKLIGLEAENFKRLRAVRLKIDGTVMKVSGRNGQGKSSLLDAVAAAIGGKDFFPAQPVRKGEKESTISLDFGALKLTRRIWTKKGGGIGHEVELTFADGRPAARPQDILDELRGSPIADDPLEFSRMKPKEQFDLLKRLVPNVDFDKLAADRKRLFDERTNVNRDLGRARTAFEASMVPGLDLSRQEFTDAGMLSKRLSEAHTHNNEIDLRLRRRESAAAEAEAQRDEADQLIARARQLNADADETEKKLKAAESLPEKIDVTALAEELDNITVSNGLALAAQKAVELRTERDKLERRHEELSCEIDDVDNRKNKAILEAKFPVDGLTLGEDEILLDDLPFSQASTARKIAVSTALLMRLKPELRVLLVREGSLLDDDARAVLEADAAANGFVVLMECVGAGDGTGIIIEDGEVKS